MNNNKYNNKIFSPRYVSLDWRFLNMKPKKKNSFETIITKKYN